MGENTIKTNLITRRAGVSFEAYTAADEKEIKRRIETLCEKYDQIKSLVVHFRVAPKDADDLVQEIFVAAYTHIHQLKSTKSMDPWLYKIAMRCVQKHYGRNKLKLEKEVQYESCTEEIEAESAYIESMEILRDDFTDDDVCEMVASLDPPAPEIIRLRYVTGLSLKEIAELMKLNYNTVKTIENRARKKLRKMILERKVIL